LEFKRFTTLTAEDPKKIKAVLPGAK